jgi:hypothetical protein
MKSCRLTDSIFIFSNNTTGGLFQKPSAHPFKFQPDDTDKVVSRLCGYLLWANHPLCCVTNNRGLVSVSTLLVLEKLLEGRGLDIVCRAEQYSTGLPHDSLLCVHSGGGCCCLLHFSIELFVPSF